ncbi:mechanosensitive ion channel family protein [Pedobacter sp. ASV28]|uniref:mechanosensitive ion channel family protein n=1 Tax=Pedobacter sp. ASV28 TaxID=2795123 RepID=UPI0018EE4630|nr:mechanosensitive ion channel family protein [Pedobacter sp. ASV28]
MKVTSTPIKLLALWALMLSAQLLFAQNKQEQDQIALNEALLMKDQQQKHIDSLIKIKIENELLEASGNIKKTKALQAQLVEMAKRDSLRNLQQLKEIATLKKNAKGYAVHLNKDTLFYIYTRMGSFKAEERAKAITQKVRLLYEDPFYSADSLSIKANDDSYDLTYKNNTIILTIANLDGLWFSKSNALLAKEYLSILKKTITEERKSHSLTNWLKRIGLVILVLLLVIAIVKVINYIFSHTARYISHHKSKFANGFRIRNVHILTAQHLETALLKLNGAVKILVILLTIYLSLPLLFSIFPETEDWTSTLLNWILSPLKATSLAIVHYLPNFFTIMVIYLIFRYVLKGVKYFFHEVKYRRITLRGFHEDWAMPTFNILRFILYAFMLVIIFPYLPGSSSPAFQGVSVFLGILISLGSSSAIGNIVAGLVITYMRPFKLGDRVKIGDVVGDVLEKNMLVTRIKTIKNEDITVPNSMVLSSSTINFSSRTKNNGPGLIVHYTVTIGYDVPWKKVYELLISAATKTIHIETTPTPFVLQTGLDNFSISYQINAYTHEANLQALIYSNLLENIQDLFNEAHIEILSPHYNVIRQEEK